MVRPLSTVSDGIPDILMPISRPSGPFFSSFAFFPQILSIPNSGWIWKVVAYSTYSGSKAYLSTCLPTIWTWWFRLSILDPAYQLPELPLKTPLSYWLRRANAPIASRRPWWAVQAWALLHGDSYRFLHMLICSYYDASLFPEILSPYHDT